MSYESTHWLCGHHRDDCDGRCRDKYDVNEDCERCGGVAMVCPCGPEDATSQEGQHGSR